MGKILVTGGSGYIGSHTIVALLEAGYEVVSIDDHSRSHDFIMNRIEQITGTKVVNHRINLVDRPALEAFFRDEAKARLALKEILSCGFEAWMVRHPVQQRRWQTSIPESICQRYQHQM